MAAAPVFKAFTGSGEYIASFRYIGDAANFVEIFGGSVRWGHNKKHTCWVSGEMEHDGYDDLFRLAEEKLARLGIDSVGAYLTTDRTTLDSIHSQGLAKLWASMGANA